MSTSTTSPSRTLHVIVACTDRKTRPVSAELTMRSLLLGSVEARVDAWTTRLMASHSDSVPAESLYAGDHWQVVRSLARAAPSNITVQTWVCSAGYGLVRLSTPIRPYAATFASGHPDAVAPRGLGYTAADWWRLLAMWCPDGASGPRTLADLAAVSPADFILVVLSGAYVAPLSVDLAAAARVIHESDHLAIISAGARPRNALLQCIVPASGRLKAALGGAMQSLNARIARRAIEDVAAWFPSRAALASLTRSWLSTAPVVQPYDRQRVDDDAVRTYIRARLDQNPRATHTSLLRTLRESGRACEQARFATLFRDVQTAIGDGRELELIPGGVGTEGLR